MQSDISQPKIQIETDASIQSDPQAMSYLQQNPLYYLNKVIGVQFLPYTLQKAIKSIPFHKRTYIPSGHGIGKTYSMAGLVPWFLETHPDSLVFTTAPTARQVSELLWREVSRHKAQAIYPLEGELLQNRLRISPTWQAYGFASNQAVAYQGFHAKYLMWILDEADGIVRDIWQSIFSTITGSDNKLVAVGNRVDPDSMFREQQDKYPNRTYVISSYESPNIIKNEKGEYVTDEIVPGCATVEWIDELIDEFGIDSNIVKSRALAEYPDAASQAIISRSAILACDDVDTLPEYWVIIGIDVAYGGDDESIITAISGNAFYEYPLRFTKLDGQELFDELDKFVKHIEFVEDRQVRIIIYDVGGVATAIHEHLAREYLHKIWKKDTPDQHRIKLIPIEFGGAVTEWRQNSKRHNMHMVFNKRAEMYMDLRRQIVKKELYIPKQYQLHLELPKIHYEIRPKDSKIIIEDKEKIKKKLGGRSPDLSDSMALAAHARVLALQYPKQSKYIF